MGVHAVDLVQLYPAQFGQNCDEEDVHNVFLCLATIRVVASEDGYHCCTTSSDSAGLKTCLAVY